MSIFTEAYKTLLCDIDTVCQYSLKPPKPPFKDAQLVTIPSKPRSLIFKIMIALLLRLADYLLPPLSLGGDLDGKLAEVLLVPHVLVSFLELLQREDLLIDHRVNVIRLDSARHILHLQPAADQDTADCADVVQGLEEGRLVLCHAADETDNADDAVDGDGLQTLGHGLGPTDLDDVLHARAASELLGLLAPVGHLIVVDDVVGAVRLECLGLGGGRCGCDDARARCLGELQGEHGDTACALGENPLPGLEGPALETVQRIPCGQAGAAECAGLEVVQVLGRGDETLLVEDSVLA